MSQINALLTGAALGAGTMFFFDPRLGNRRRKLLADQFTRLSHETAEGLDAAWRDLKNRAYGTAAETRAMVRSDHASDDVICQRVRSKAGRILSHPAALEVDVSDGHVILSGPVLADEADPLVSAIRWVRGVRSVECRLDCHERSTSHPALQGEGRRAGNWGNQVTSNWAPATRLLAGATGGLLLANCMMSRSASGWLGGTFGMALLMRATGNLDWGRTFGVTGGRRSIDIVKTIEIQAPIEVVFEFFADPQNYARITDAFTNIESLGDDRYAKEMQVAGTAFRFEERFTHCESPTLLEVASEPGSMLQYMKHFQFDPTEGGTRVQVLFSYNPPGGVLAHAAAAALGFDPKTLLDNLMMRAKTFLETGKEPHDAARHATYGRPSHASLGGTSASRQYAHDSEPAGESAASTAWKMATPASSGEGEQSSTWPAAPPQHPERPEQAGRFPPM